MLIWKWYKYKYLKSLVNECRSPLFSLSPRYIALGISSSSNNFTAYSLPSTAAFIDTKILKYANKHKRLYVMPFAFYKLFITFSQTCVGNCTSDNVRARVRATMDKGCKPVFEAKQCQCVKVTWRYFYFKIITKYSLHLKCNEEIRYFYCKQICR